MASEDLPAFQLAQHVATVRDRKNAAIVWPRPVDHRLDKLVEAANRAGERTNRTELAAAILCAANRDPTVLREWLTEYRTATVGDVLPWYQDDAGQLNVVSLPVHRPGPRT